MAASGDLINFDIIEAQKENIQALPSGRSAKKLAEAFSPSPLHKLSTPTPTGSKNVTDCIRADWEMSTVGHPLSDLCNLSTQFFTASRDGVNAHRGFLPGATPGLPDAAQVVRWYADGSGYDPAAELGWGMAFNVFRLSAVCQGIAARYARRQASSEKAKQYSETRAPLAEFAWELVETSRKGEGAVAKL
ncbi:hypothetical protein BN1708_011066 [Verticillium longisporum]|uniref:Uncharacterized protein n=1 Tax=Verticillium longisporum TaxID=100787 RepID=A0A0G4KWG2_VERLO|nr:hypothetical protein BN1708_011066 [Verticillium longisporum]